MLWRIVTSRNVYPIILLFGLIIGIYWQFFLFDKIPMPGDLLIGAYFPWLDYKWGYEVGVPVKNPLISDVFSQFFVWKYLIVDLVRNGEFPLYNIYSLSGASLFATYYSAVLNPFNILLFLPKFYGWGLFIFGQTLLAGLGMYFIAGVYTKSIFPRLISSLVFCLGGLMTTWVEFGTGVYAAATLPWIIYFLERFLEKNQFKYFLGIVSFFIILFFAGNVQLTQFITLIYLIYLIYLRFIRQLSYKGFVFSVSGLVISVFIAAIQIIPSLDLVTESIRGKELSFFDLYQEGLNEWFDAIRFVIADFFGNPVTANYWGKGSYHEQASFVGTLTLPFLITLVSKKKWLKENLFWFIGCLICLILAFKNPISFYVYSLDLPLFNQSNPSRIFFILNFFVAILLGIGVERYIQELEYRKLFKKTLIGYFVIVVGLLVIVGLGSKGIIDIENIVVNANTDNLQVAIRNLVIPVVLISILLIAVLFKRIKFVLVVMLVLTYLDLGRYFLKYNPFVDQTLVLPVTPAIRYLQEQQQDHKFRIAKLDSEVMPMNTHIFYKLESIEGYDALANEKYTRYMMLTKGADYNSVVSRYVEIDKISPRFADSLNLKYLLTVKRDDKGNVKGDNLSEKALNLNYPVVYEDKNTLILQNPTVKGRAYFIKKVVSVENFNKVIEQIATKDFDPTTIGVLIGGENREDLSTTGKIDFVEYLNSRIKLVIDNKEDSFLVLSVPHTKDWEVSIDGKQSKLYQVNSALMGIYLGPGKHLVEFNYLPRSLIYGSIASSMGVLLLFTMIIVSSKRKIFNE